MLFELQSYLNLNVASKKQEGSSRQAKENTAATKIYEAFLVSRWYLGEMLSDIFCCDFME